MSSMLEQAVVDAKQLREAALRRAENEVLKNSAAQIREAMNRILEEPEDDDLGLEDDALSNDPIADPMGSEGGEVSPVVGDIPYAATDGQKLCPCPDEEDEVEIDFDQLRGQIGSEDGMEADMGVGEDEDDPSMMFEEEEYDLPAKIDPEYDEKPSSGWTSDISDDDWAGDDYVATTDDLDAEASAYGYDSWDEYVKGETGQDSITEGSPSDTISLDPELGSVLHQFHMGMGDPIYQAGSLAVAGKPIPKDIAEQALDSLESMAAQDDELANDRELEIIMREMQRALETSRQAQQYADHYAQQSDEPPFEEGLETGDDKYLQEFLSSLSSVEEASGPSFEGVTRHWQRQLDAEDALADYDGTRDSRDPDRYADEDEEEKETDPFRRYQSSRFDELDETDLDAMLEMLTVDYKTVPNGWRHGGNDSQEDEAAHVAAAAMQDKKKEEEVKALSKALEDLKGLQEQVKTAKKNELNALKEQKRLRGIAQEALRKSKELNLDNAKLSYMNRILEDASLNGRQKNKLVEAISKVGSLEEAKTAYGMVETIKETAKEQEPSQLSEAIRKRGTVLNRRTNESAGLTPERERLQRLAGIRP